MPLGGTAVPERQFPDPLGGEADHVAGAAEDLELGRLTEGAEHFRRHAGGLVPAEVVEVEAEDEDGGAGGVEGEGGLEAADHEDEIAVAATDEAGPIEDIEDVPPLVAVEGGPDRDD